MMHDLKILPCYFVAVANKEKTFEIRNNADRGFQKGDTVTLHEIAHDGKPTGRRIYVTITYVTNYNQPENQVVFGFTLKSGVIYDAKEIAA